VGGWEATRAPKLVTEAWFKAINPGAWGWPQLKVGAFLFNFIKQHVLSLIPTKNKRILDKGSEAYY